MSHAVWTNPSPCVWYAARAYCLVYLPLYSGQTFHRKCYKTDFSPRNQILAVSQTLRWHEQKKSSYYCFHKQHAATLSLTFLMQLLKLLASRSSFKRMVPSVSLKTESTVNSLAKFCIFCPHFYDIFAIASTYDPLCWMQTQQSTSGMQHGSDNRHKARRNHNKPVSLYRYF